MGRNRDGSEKFGRNFRLIFPRTAISAEKFTCSNLVTAKMGHLGLYFAIMWADLPVRVRTMIHEALHLNEASTTDTPVTSVMSFEMPVVKRKSEKYLK